MRALPLIFVLLVGCALSSTRDRRAVEDLPPPVEPTADPPPVASPDDPEPPPIRMDPPPGACWMDEDPLPDLRADPVDPVAVLHDTMLEEQLESVEQQVGQYTRGVVPIYAGALFARDNTGVLGLGHTDGLLSEGPVTASLTEEEDAWRLRVYAATRFRKVDFVQRASDAGATEVGMVHRYGTVGGVYGTCLDCVTPLSDAPDTVEVSADGRGWFPSGVAFEVTATGGLERVPTGEVSWNDVLVVNEVPGVSLRDVEHFRLAGDERVRSVERSMTARADDLLGGVDGYEWCERQATMTVEQWVDATCLGRYGVRVHEFRVTATRCCNEPFGDGPADCIDVD